MRKISIVVLIIGLIIVAGYIYLRVNLKTEDPHPGGVLAAPPEKPKTVLDLRPKLIAKLQELVNKGSDGLYDLSIEKIDPDLVQSKVEVLNARLIPNAAILAQLNKNKKAPDDVFKIFSHSIHIDGIGIEDLFSKNVIDLKNILINDPVIEVYHEKRAYNQTVNEKPQSLYQKLMGQMKKIAVAEIVIKNGSLIMHREGSKTPLNFKEVSMHMKDLLVDSTTQYDKKRFLFASFAELRFKNFKLPTGDNLYWLNAGAVSISATDQKLSAVNVSLQPRGSKQEFEKKLKHRQVMYNVSIPSLQLSTINWWNLFNEEGLKANELNISKAKCSVFLDRSLPPAHTSPNNFPHQLLAALSVPVHVNNVNIRNSAITYQEYNPLSKKSGTVYLNAVNARIANLTNIPDVMQRNSTTTLKASALFMHKAMLGVNLQFNLAKIKTGEFNASIEMGALDNTVLNPLAEPMGLFFIKKGNLQKGTATIRGNNYNATGKVLVLYNDLHITPLKPAGMDSTSLKKKHVTSFIANTFLIKDENPSYGEAPRSPEAAHKRIEGSDLFNLIWKTMLVGILKTIGISPKYAD